MKITAFSKRLTLLVPLLVVLLMELFLFNLPFWTTVGNNNSQNVSLTAGNGFVKNADGLWHVTDAKNAYLHAELVGDANISYIKVRPKTGSYVPSRWKVGKTFLIEPYVRDEGNQKSAIKLGVTAVSENLQESHYIPLHPAGKVSELNLSFKNLVNGDALSLNDIELNPHRPFMFSFIRFFILLSVGYVFFAFRPKSVIYTWQLSFKDKRQLAITLFIIVISCLVLFAVSRLIQPSRIFSGASLHTNGAFINDDNQYNHVANALLNGHAYLDLPVPQWLADMKNPYDTGMRYDFSLKTGQPTYWDYAFYGGKYYSYFGVLPVLLLFIPFKVITGQDLRTDYAVVVFSFLLVFAICYCIYKFLKKYCTHTTFGFYLTSAIAFIVGGSTLTQVYLPKIYSLPMLASLVFTLVGLGLWCDAYRVREGSQGHLSMWKLALGAVCIALNLGGRPQFILATFFAFPIFWEQIVHERLFFSRKGIVNTLSVIVPYFVVGIPAMMYNKIRFNSYFEFGAAYNLTGFDITHHSHAVMRIPVGLWMYFVQPINFSVNYPFIVKVDEPEGFMAQFIMEPYYGGFLFFAPFVVLLLNIWWCKKILARSRAQGITISLIFGGLLVATMDSLLIGVNSRYFGDFAWFFILATILVVQTILDANSTIKIDELESKPVASALPSMRVEPKWLLKCWYVLIMVGFVLSFMNLLSDGRYFDLAGANNTVYRIVEAWFRVFQ